MGPRVILSLSAILLALLSLPVGAADAGLDIGDMPQGNEITIPSTAKSTVPLGGRFALTASERPQAVSFSSVHLKGGKVSPIRLAIFDRSFDRVRYLDLQPGTSIIYRFKGLRPIHVLPTSLQSGADSSELRLQVSSDHPLTIGR